MRYHAFSDLSSCGERAVIINAGTKVAATLALMSALRHAGMPVLVIDCERGDGSPGHFIRLMKTLPFDLLSAPLRKHGETLDWLFAEIPAEKVMLIDSDVEILDSEIVRFMRIFIDEPNVFGSGFVHGPCWIQAHPGIGYYQERMWISFTLLKTAPVRSALESGRSFRDRIVYNDFVPSRLLSRLLAARFRVPALRTLKLSCLNPFKETFYGHKPSYLYCDTGADLFQYLKYQRELHFAGFPAELHARHVLHFNGVTRLSMDRQDASGLKVKNAVYRIRERLERVYGTVLDEE